MKLNYLDKLYYLNSKVKGTYHRKGLNKTTLVTFLYEGPCKADELLRDDIRPQYSTNMCNTVFAKSLVSRNVFMSSPLNLQRMRGAAKS